MGDPTKPRRSRKSRGAQKRQQEQQHPQGLQMDPGALREARESLGLIDRNRNALMASAGAVGTEEGVDFDFDRHWSEKAQKAQPRRVRIRGRMYLLPGSMPAAVMAIGMRREFRDPDRVVDTEEAMRLTLDMLTAAIGEDAVAQMMRDGITMDEFPDVLSYVVGAFDEIGRARDVLGEPDPGEAGGGKAPAVSGT